MSKLCCAALLFTLLIPGQGIAGWMEDFIDNTNKFGIDTAIENALSDGATPNDILTFILGKGEQFETKVSLKALYCGGADWTAVQEAANGLGIPTDEVSTALEESIAECGSKLSLGDRDPQDEPASGPAGGAADSPLPGTVETGVQSLLDNPEEAREPASPSRP